MAKLRNQKLDTQSPASLNKKHFISFLKKRIDGIFIAMDEREKRYYVFRFVRVLEGKNANEIKFDGVTLKGSAIS